eukprot:1975234-Prorocentrum_lima.AAC.1
MSVKPCCFPYCHGGDGSSHHIHGKMCCFPSSIPGLSQALMATRWSDIVGLNYVATCSIGSC